MTAHEGFWKQRQPAAVLKHRVLVNYLTPWATMVTKNAPHSAVYVDGYAGAGRYDTEGGLSRGQAGSPVIAAQVASKVRGFTPSRQLRCVFVERSVSTADALRSVLTKEFADRVGWQVVCGDLSERISSIVADAGGAPMFLFLDPFGTGLPKAVLVNDVLKTAGARGPVEVLLNFTIEGVWRIGGHLRAGGTGPAISRADDFLGGSWWHEPFRLARIEAESTGSRAPAAKAAHTVAEKYNQMIAAETGCSVLSVPVRRTPGSEPFFQLSLIYRHPAAELLFADAAAKANQEWRRIFWDREAEIANTPPGYAELLFPAFTEGDWDRREAELRDARRARLADRLRGMLDVAGVVPIGERMREVFADDLGSATESDLRQAWKSLAREGVADPPPSGRLRGATLWRTGSASA